MKENDNIKNLIKLARESFFNLEPIKLNDQNVSILYQNCLASSSTPESDQAEVTALIPSFTGMKSPTINFSKSQLYLYSENIIYLFGQMYAVHLNNEYLKLSDGAYDYTKKPWTKDTNSLLHLYELGIGADCITQFRGEKTKSFTDICGISPTFPPEDPKCDSFFKQYQKDLLTPNSDAFQKRELFCKKFSEFVKEIQRLNPTEPSDKDER